MNRTYGDVNARARGLQGHLLSPVRLGELARLRTLSSLGAELVREGYPPAAGRVAIAAELGTHIESVAADRLDLLAQWLGPRTVTMRAYLERRELVTLRAILRGAAAGAAPAARLRGIQPSALWPAGLLTQLAGAGSIPAVGRLLQRARHPAAAVFEVGAPGARQLDLLELELAMRHWWAARVSVGLRHAGRAVREFASQAMDVENLLTLLLAPAWGMEVAPGRVFLPGGLRLELERFVELARLDDESSRRAALARHLSGTPAGRVLSDGGIPVIALPRLLRAAAIREARRAARLAPLGPAPTVEVILRIEAEAEDLRRLAHGIGLEAPVAVTTTGVLAAA